MTDEDTSAPAPGLDPWQARPPAAPRRVGGVRGRTAAMATVVGLAGGGLVGGYVITHAATGSPTPTPSSGTPPSGGATAPDGSPGHHGGPGGPQLGGPNDPAEDEQTIAGAIGISVSQFETELKSDGTIAAVAKAHGVDASKVVAAIVAAKDKEIDAAVTAGTLTQAQATQQKADAQQMATDMVNATGRPGGHGGPGGGPGGPGLQQEDLDLVAGALGISSSQLQTDLSGGQTIAAIAKSRNVDVTTVIATWVASENKEIDARVASGQLTQSQADQQKQQTQQRVTDEVDGTGHGGPGGPRGGQPAPGTSGTTSPTA